MATRELYFVCSSILQHVLEKTRKSNTIMVFKLFLVSIVLLGTQAHGCKSTEIDTEDLSDIELEPNVAIFGGSVASQGEFPYTVSLQKVNPQDGTRKHFCGGSILDEKWILTAAHCVTNEPPSNKLVIAGSNNQVDLLRSAQVVPVAMKFEYSSFGRHNLEDDIALLKLQTPLNLNRLVNTVKLPKKGVIPTGNGIASGWGSDKRDGFGTVDKLRKFSAPIIDHETCNRLLTKRGSNSTANEVFPTELCTGSDFEKPTSVCNGDSGGPLAQRKDSGPDVIVGVISWRSKSFCDQPTPSVYVDVAQFVDWIEATMKMN